MIGKVAKMVGRGVKDVAKETAKEAVPILKDSGQAISTEAMRALERIAEAMTDRICEEIVRSTDRILDRLDQGRQDGYTMRETPKHPTDAT